MHSSADAERSIGTSSSSGSSSLSPPPSSALLPKDWHWHAGEQAMLETFVKSFEGKAVNWSAVAAAIAATFPAQGMDAVRSAEECEQKWINGEQLDLECACTRPHVRCTCAVLAERSLAGPRQVRPTPPKIILHNHANVPPTRGPNWRPDQINQLISAVTGRTSGPYISDVEWTEIGLSLTPTRTWQSCKRKWNMVQQEDYRRQSAVLVVQDQAASGKAQSPTIGDDPAPSPVSTTPSYTGRRLKPYAGPPSAQDGNGNALVSVGEQPFSPEEDFIMLEMLSRRPAVSYKYIAFSLNPPRYKAEVRRRLRDL